MPFAEVIGDPVVQSKSPVIHKHWLGALGLEGDYVRTRVAADELQAFLEKRRADSDWRGCNVTIPHKERIISLLDRIDPAAELIGAINCVIPLGDDLTGFNTDIDGVAAALDSTAIEGRKVAVVGAGGGARALIHYLGTRGVGEVVLLVRDPSKVGGKFGVEALPLNQSGAAFEHAAAIVNASPLGMTGAPEMPAAIIDAVAANARAITVFDMVTTPADTALLRAALTGGASCTVDGLTMLIGQARRAFEWFFGATPPKSDSELRKLLTQQDH